MNSSANNFINAKLQDRKLAGNYRELNLPADLVDFCSNDYLGFARSAVLRGNIERETANNAHLLNGSTGSRLLAGNTAYAEKLETEIATHHGYEAGLIYNSGYDANLGLFSSLPQRGDTIITDELIHASVIDGSRLSYANRFTFKHNDLLSLEEKLKHARGNVYVGVESIYSMDGDAAPLRQLVDLAKQYNAHLIVDEAHATGVFGKGLVDNLNLQHQVFAQITTFGKGLGCHGAIVLGSNLLRQYLINFSRSFIYTTAAPLHQLATIKSAYKMLDQATPECENLHSKITYFKKQFNHPNYQLINSNSAIQCVLIGGNSKCKALATLIQNNGMDVRPILSPTVAAGAERLRICLHSYNTEAQISQLLQLINNFEHE